MLHVGELGFAADGTCVTESPVRLVSGSGQACTDLSMVRRLSGTRRRMPRQQHWEGHHRFFRSCLVVVSAADSVCVANAWTTNVSNGKRFPENQTGSNQSGPERMPSTVCFATGLQGHSGLCLNCRPEIDGRLPFPKTTSHTTRRLAHVKKVQLSTSTATTDTWPLHACDS